MTFDFENFVTSLYQQYPDDLDLPQLKELLDLGDDYTRDTPISTGKRLIIDKISFAGSKFGSENQSYSNDKINYSQKIETGVNIWIADNLKGKSSIFKIIKFPLTGRNRLKPNIKKWIQHILLNFSINDKSYSVYLNTEKTLKASLYNGQIDLVENISQHFDDLIFTATSENKYEKLIEDFFFRQFSYYSLRWTQKSPQKDKEELLEVGASWATYFESIFLESRDSGNLTFGGQGKKVFQMLLGLEFTYPINRLSVERDRLQYEKAKQINYSEAHINKKKKDEDILKIRSVEIDQEIIELEKNSGRLNTEILSNEYDDLLYKVRINNQKSLSLENELKVAQKQLNDIDSSRQDRGKEMQRLSKEVQKLNKQINDLEEFIQIGIFFSNLDIKHCPSCDHQITEQKKVSAVNSKTCSVCNDPIDTADSVDSEEYNNKVVNLKTYRDGLIPKLESLKSENDDDEYQKIYNDILRIQKERATLENTIPWNERLIEISNLLQEEQNRPKPEKAKLDLLIAEKAVIQYRLLQMEAVEDNVDEENYNSKIQILTAAIDELNRLRLNASDKVLQRLSTLMLDEIHQLGLTSITDIEITETLDIRYRQDGDLITFDDIAEGEQLRAKIAFYLSLIQLDIEYNFGRHTRFLIIDSPAKEEADDNYMQGLSTVLQTINNRFGNNLQILIGTAERTLTNVVGNEYVTPVNEFVF